MNRITALWRSLTPAQQKALSGLLAAVIAVLTAFGVLNVDTPSATTVTVQGPTGPTTITVPAEELDAINTHPGAQDQSPEEVQIAADEESAKQAEADPLSPLAPLAAPSQPGCKTRLIHSNAADADHSFSSRHGTKPAWVVSHYTVSPNLPGFRDLDNLTAYSANRQNMVSWHYNVDREGHCYHTVREVNAAWTQAAANRLSIGIEIINRGRNDAPLFTAAGLKRYARVVSDIARRWNIPIQRGKANKSTCAVIRRGLIDHNDLGACGGGHHDITPYSIESIIAAVKRHRATTARTINYPTRSHFGPQRRKWCKQLAILRKNADADRQRGKQAWPLSRRVAANRYKQRIGAGEQRCRFV